MLLPAASASRISEGNCHGYGHSRRQMPAAVSISMAIPFGYPGCRGCRKQHRPLSAVCTGFSRCLNRPPPVRAATLTFPRFRGQLWRCKRVKRRETLRIRSWRIHAGGCRKRCSLLIRMSEPEYLWNLLCSSMVRLHLNRPPQPLCLLCIPDIRWVGHCGPAQSSLS